MAADWLGASRSEVAAERILDAASELFARHDVAGVGMNEIARAAGCSRATLYRYFENREALHTAYMNREAYRLNQVITDELAGIAAPRERLIAAITIGIAQVRENPALASWFAATQPPIGVELAEQSEVIKALTAAFLVSLGPDGPDAEVDAVVERRARWLVRVITSLLLYPGDDEADERQMLEEFVVPIVAPAATRAT
ncbi:TetR/AcrR family transcriptional regulator [Mycobacterium sp. MYCO198283]|uniref:TetR/AcrR family transcriptional regulator n=1 Tax=Mycobacterium sp. MYCO198283 TaxID=2883505 RepID=UPI001E509B9B|nr:TetR/AcrR family transcriptional regulator [Mycobacterium sp. MYCO198283]MCG5430745.1 TetR/AcrR family transcriptional regulator [Mycobacterium sp. MYCO198283]